MENWQIGKLYKLKCNFMKILVLQIFFPLNKSSYYNQLLYNYIRFFVPSYSLWNITSFFSSARLIVFLTMNQPLLRISWRSEWKIRKKISSVRGILFNNWFHFHKRSHNFFTSGQKLHSGTNRFNCFKIDWYRCNSANQTLFQKIKRKIDRERIIILFLHFGVI